MIGDGAVRSGAMSPPPHSESFPSDELLTAALGSDHQMHETTKLYVASRLRALP